MSSKESCNHSIVSLHTTGASALKEAARFEFGDATFGMDFDFFSNTVKM